MRLKARHLTAGCAAAGLLAVLTPERRQRVHHCALSGRRALRAAVCAGRIAARYKRLGSCADHLDHVLTRSLDS